MALPAGPILYAATLLGHEATLRPIAELAGDSLLALEPRTDPSFAPRFAEREYRPGTEFVLFSADARLGTAVAYDTISAEPALCPLLPGVRGAVELAPHARELDHFLAFRKDAVAPQPPRTPAAPALDGAMRNASWQIALREITSRNERQPRDWLRARAQISALAPGAGATPAFAATYLYGDILALGPPQDSAYSLLFLAEDRGPGFQPTYVWFRSYSGARKAAARLYDFLDWDRDGTAQIVLQVFGATRQWFAAVARRPQGWRLIYEDPCSPAHRPDTITSPGSGETGVRAHQAAAVPPAPAPEAQPSREGPPPRGTPAGQRRPTPAANRRPPTTPPLPAVRTDLAVPGTGARRDTIP